MKLLLSILVFTAYTDASAQFYSPSLERINRDSDYSELKRQRQEMLDLQRETLRLQREALEQQRSDAFLQHIQREQREQVQVCPNGRYNFFGC